MSAGGENSVRRGRRSKPAIAFQSQHAAKVNIQTKLKVLVAYLSEPSDGDEPGELCFPKGLPVLDQCPRSVRQFNSWTSSTLPPELAKCTPLFLPNANDTLRLHPDLHASVVQAIARVKTRRLLSSRKKNPLETIAGLHRRLLDAQLIADIAKREARAALVELEVTKQELADVLHTREALEREVAAALLSAQSQLAELRERNAELTKAYSKISKIKRS